MERGCTAESYPLRPMIPSRIPDAPSIITEHSRVPSLQVGMAGLRARLVEWFSDGSAEVPCALFGMLCERCSRWSQCLTSASTRMDDHRSIAIPRRILIVEEALRLACVAKGPLGDL